MVIINAQLHSIKLELRFFADSNPARGVSEIRDGKDLWQWSGLEIRLNAFRLSTIPQKQFIIIIIIMYKKAITGEYICSWKNLLWATEELNIFNIVIHENWKLLEVETVEISASYPISFSVLQCIVLTNIMSNVRVSLSKKPKDSNLKESID